ncbi:MAG TPA: hypothetical protein VHM70_04930 [Polyangiaceae bacterium]|jgi:hypothetical protein|nr:hypothetical protein [Polyangiaceae bacterium]
MSFRFWLERLLQKWPERAGGNRQRSTLDSTRLALALALVIVLSARLSLPQAIAPHEIPLPVLDRQKQQAEAQVEEARASRAMREPLSRDVRSVGELVRRIGALEAQQPTDGAPLEDPEHLRIEAARLARSLVQGGAQEALLELRALQTRLFVEAVSRPERADELRELGGSFASRFGALGGAPKAELAAAYRSRWTELVGLAGTLVFAPTLNDVRLSARLRLRVAATLPDARHLTSRTLDELGAADTEYPLEYARGVAEFRAGAYAESFAHFQQFLSTQPDGPWHLRAQNHAQAAAAYLVDGP